MRDSDPAHHGTNVSGIVAAVAPGANLSVYNVFEETPDGLLADDTVILQALNDIVANASARNIRSVNMSLGTDELQTSECTESVYTSVFLTLRAMGVVPVVSSGNGAFQSGSFQSGVGAPACAPGAVRVGAVYPQNGETRSWGNPPCTDTDPQTDDVACFSQSSPILSLLAPGASRPLGSP